MQEHDGNETGNAGVLTAVLPQPYRPSNGDEGCWFQQKFCDRCEREREYREKERSPCSILGLTMALDIDDPDYPKQWVEDENGPRCTAFRPEGSPPQEQLDRDRARYERAMAEMRDASPRLSLPPAGEERGEVSGAANHNRLVPELITRLVKETDGESDAMVALESLIFGVMLFYRPKPSDAAEYLDMMTVQVLERMHADAARTN
jgi:hypothetical protein